MFCVSFVGFWSFSPSHLAVLDKDLTSAKALQEQMQKEGIVADELSLKRLAGLYREAGEPLPFPEPPVSRSHVRNAQRRARPSDNSERVHRNRSFRTSWKQT